MPGSHALRAAGLEAQPRRVNVNRLPEAQDQLLNPAAAPVERQVVKAIAKQQLNHDQAVT